MKNPRVDFYSTFDFEDKRPQLEIYFNKNGYINFFGYT